MGGVNYLLSGHVTLGQTRLPNGSLLREEIAKDPNAWLGPDHVRAFGVDTKILVKLLDAGQRLPIQAHPSGAWAQANIGARHGKAEAWYLLHAGDVYLGLTQDATLEKLKSLVDAQDVETMLNLMHRVPVKAHQTVYVPHGTLHAIGKGILTAEIQQPEDLSILLEWRDFNIDGRVDGHVGLGFERALQAVKIRARSEKEILTLVTNENATGSVLVTESNEYFLLERVLVNGSSTQRAGFALVIIVGWDDGDDPGAWKLVTVEGRKHSGCPKCFRLSLAGWQWSGTVCSASCTGLKHLIRNFRDFFDSLFDLFVM